MTTRAAPTYSAERTHAEHDVYETVNSVVSLPRPRNTVPVTGRSGALSPPVTLGHPSSDCDHLLVDKTPKPHKYNSSLTATIMETRNATHDVTTPTDNGKPDPEASTCDPSPPKMN